MNRQYTDFAINLPRKDAINHYKDAINRRLYKRLIIVETAIHRVSCLNRTAVGYANAFVISAFAFVISGYSFVISGYSFVISGYAIVISGYAFVISGYAFVISGYAIVISGYAFVISGYAFVISGYAFVISGFAFIDFVITVADCTYSQTTNRSEK